VAAIFAARATVSSFNLAHGTGPAGAQPPAQAQLSVSLIDETAKWPTSEASEFQVHETASRILRLVLLDHANLLLGSWDIRR